MHYVQSQGQAKLSGGMLCACGFAVFQTILRRKVPPHSVHDECPEGPLLAFIVHLPAIVPEAQFLYAVQCNLRVLI